MKFLRSIADAVIKRGSLLFQSLKDKIRFYSVSLIYYLRTSDASYFLVFSILVGLGGGFGAIIFRWLIMQVKNLFFVRGETVLGFMGQYYVIALPAIGGLIVGLLVFFLAREAKGHGVPEVMRAVLIGGGKIRPRVAVVKALASSVCIGSGGSVGREGPIIQIGSALGSAIGQLFKLTEEKTKTLVACGAAAGIAATFNSPLGGIFFALEVILREYGLRNFSSVVMSSVTATVISRHFLGNQPAFQIPPFDLYQISDFLYYLVFAILASVVAWLFIKVLYKSEDIFNKIKLPEYFKPVVGGLLVGIIGFYFPQIFGVGYEVIEASARGELVLWIVITLVFLKILATSLTLGSGGSGGIFAPSLYIGALLGEAFGLIVQRIIPGTTIPPGAFALVGMASVFAATSQAPISAILLLFEMTGNYKILPPLMITCVLSAVLVRWWSKYSIYTLKLVRRGIDVERYQYGNLMESITVSQAMISDVITVMQTDTVRKVGLMIKETNHRGFPVMTEDGHLAGMVTRTDINKALTEGHAEAEIKSVMSSDLIVCYPNESLKTAMHKIASKNIGRMPVVERDNKEHLIGILTRKSLIASYYRALEFKKTYSDSRSS
ncbi:MAG: chloride channel protein [Bacteroidales bacterium]|jgi:CIC family chloride channel protein|nr:chloride channel protein [Bacteroidales bacterium]